MKTNLSCVFKFIFCALFFFSNNLQSQNVATFLNPVPSPPVNCNDSWVEDGIPLKVVAIPPGSFCSFDYNNTNPGDLWLWPARLEVDLTVFINGIDSIKVTFTDHCGLGCTVDTILFNGNVVAGFENTTVQMQESWFWDNTISPVQVDMMYMQSFEGQFHEIKIYPTPPPMTNCPVNVEVAVEQGDIYVDNACHGIIFTSPNGNCYRMRVDDNGGLIYEQITCP